MPPGPASQAQTTTSLLHPISPSISSSSNPKRNRANRLGNSIRRAGQSLNPRNIVSERNQHSARSKQSIHSLDSNSNSIDKSDSSPNIQSAVPMTPISLECNPFDNDQCNTARPSDPSTTATHSFISSEISPVSSQNQVTHPGQSKPTTDAISPSFTTSLTSAEPQTFSPFSPRPHFDEHSDTFNSYSPRRPFSTICIPTTPTLDQSSLPSTSPSTYRLHYDNNSQMGSPRNPPHHSQSILTIALEKAQTAVQLDTALQIPEAILAYTESVLLLEEVIDKIEVMSKERERKEHEGLMRDQARDRIWAEELWSHLSRDNLSELDREQFESQLREKERKWREKQKKIEKRKQARADEEDRLVGIHNTYASRIAELQAEVLATRLTLIGPDQKSVDTLKTSSNHTQESTDQSALRSNSFSQDHDQLVLPIFAEAERTSISSDSTTRAGITSESYEPSAILQPAVRELAFVSPLDSQSSRKSLEITEEEKDVVSERLPVPPQYGNSQNNRNRSSSSTSGTSLSQLGRPDSIESIATTRTSISSSACQGDQWLPTGTQQSAQSSLELLDGRKRSSIVNILASNNRPISLHSARPSNCASISVRPESPSSVVHTIPANQNIQRQSSQMLLVSDTTTRGTISQRRRSPTCLDVKGRLLPISDDHEQSDALSHSQYSSSFSSEAKLGIGNQIAISMGRRPSNVSLMHISPSSAVPLRLRSYSQPGKRPNLLSFITDKAPPVPRSPNPMETVPPSFRPVSRKSPSLLINSPLSNGDSLDPLASRSASSIVSTSALVQASTNVVSSRSDTHQCSTSAAVYGIQPYAHASPSAGSNQTGVLAPVGLLPTYPKSASRRPFHLMRQISTSISSGAYVSPRLYVPRQMWYQAQVKLHGLETKIKLMDTLLAGLELVERDGASLVGRVEGLNKGGGNWDLGGNLASSATSPSQALNATERFIRRLEIFEELLDNLQTGGAKKLGLNGSGPHDTAYGQDAMRKGTGFGTLMAHKLGKGLDRISLRSNTDLPTSYIETIARLFEKSQAIDVHLASLEHASRLHSLGNNNTVGGVGLYNSIGQQSKQHIEGRLRRVSEFYSTVVCRFVVADMGVLLDKYVKRGGNWCGE